MLQRHKVFLLLLFPLLLVSCGGSVIPMDPVQEIRKSFAPNRAYTVLLKDMDLRNDQYFHKYSILEIADNSNVKITHTDWKKVSDEFFMLHEDNLGMEVISQTTYGKINGLITPPGFTNIIGNEQFGSWVPIYTDTVNVESYSDSTIWTFNDKHAHLTGELGLTNIPVTKLEFDQFQQNFLFNRPFYGETSASDSTKYGTRSHYFYRTYPGFYSRRAQTRNFYKSYPTTSRGNRGGGGFGK